MCLVQPAPAPYPHPPHYPNAHAHVRANTPHTYCRMHAGCCTIAGALVHVPQLTSLEYVHMPHVCVRLEGSELVDMRPSFGPSADVWM